MKQYGLHFSVVISNNNNNENNNKNHESFECTQFEVMPSQLQKEESSCLILLKHSKFNVENSTAKCVRGF